MVETLGTMKGAAMKAGQMASLMDFNGLSSCEVAEFQARFEDLRDSAPRVPFKDMQKVIERDLGERISDVFCEFDRDAAAAASIGQVYRARLHDGREVAVKVQYPGVAAAVRADVQNLGLLMRAAKRFAPGLDATAPDASPRWNGGASRVGPITPQERQQIIQKSVLFGHYEKQVDRESAYERLKNRAESAPVTQGSAPSQAPSPVGPQPSSQPPRTSWTDSIGSVLGQLGGGGRREGMAEALAKSAARAIGSQVGRQIVRGVLGGILGGATTRRRY